MKTFTVGSCLTLVGVLGAAACRPVQHILGARCERPSDCGSGLICVDRRCRQPLDVVLTGEGDTTPSEVAIDIIPKQAALETGESLQFQAQVTNSEDLRVLWSIVPVGSGTIDSGLYIAPAVPGTFSVIATSGADPTKSALATVTVRAVLGQSCQEDMQCQSGFCQDAVCCESRCDGPCMRCDAQGVLGECSAVTQGTDPDTCSDSATSGACTSPPCVCGLAGCAPPVVMMMTGCTTGTFDTSTFGNACFGD